MTILNTTCTYSSWLMSARLTNAYCSSTALPPIDDIHTWFNISFISLWRHLWIYFRNEVAIGPSKEAFRKVSCHEILWNHLATPVGYLFKYRPVFSPPPSSSFSPLGQFKNNIYLYLSASSQRCNFSGNFLISGNGLLKISVLLFIFSQFWALFAPNCCFFFQDFITTFRIC